MAHLHNVYDTDKHFLIDAVTMDIQNTSDKIKLIQRSHRSERFTFEIPRYIDGHDMSLCNRVEVHYNNIKGDKTATSKGVYKIKDLQISPDSEEVVIFSWLISRKSTKHEGTLNFCVRFACIDENTTVEYERFTDIHKGISISESYYNSEQIIADYSDILEAWKKELEELAAAGGGLTEVAWEDIKNKPFGEIKNYDDLNYDGKIDENSVTTNTVEIYDQEICLVKVGELPKTATAADYISKSDTITLGNDEHFKTKDLISHETGGSAILYEGLGLPLAVAIDEANTVINGYEYPEAGLYLIYSKFPDGTIITVKNITFKTVNPLDEKYMPESYGELQKDVLQLNEKSKRYDQFESKIETNATKITKAEEHNVTISEQLNSHANDFNKHLPTVNLVDKGKFLRVNDFGHWAAETVPNAKGVAF